VELAGLKADVAHLRQSFAVSERHACELMGIAASTYRYRSRRSDEALKQDLVELAREKPRFGYRRLHVLLCRRGVRVNHKRVWRVYQAAGLAVRRRKRKRLVRAGTVTRKAVAANEEWAVDFAADSIATGRSVRILNVVDTFTRECLAMEVDTGFPSRRLTRVLDQVIAWRGAPKSIRCDNGPELTSRHFLAWCNERQIELRHIQPGRPMQNGHVESFTGKLRDECLNVSWFRNLFDARRKIAAWRDEYNHQRPHSSLEYLTPEAFAVRSAWPFPVSVIAPGRQPQGCPPARKISATLTLPSAPRLAAYDKGQAEGSIGVSSAVV
jgi:putative transposase